jgi:DNA-directed RNA polymerase subunit alpha
MPARNPLDTMIGAGETQRNAEAAATHLKNADRYQADGNKEAAIAELRRATAADPTNSRNFFKLAYLLDLAGEEDEAIAMYERSCEMPPAPVNALINLAVLYEDRSDFGRAERCLRQVLDTNPNHPRARLFMKDLLASREMIVDEDHDRDKTKRNALLDTPVTDFELTVRARTCLKKMNIRTLGDLLRTTEAELMGYKNFGESSLVEIKQMLAAKGLRLGQGVEDAHRAARRRIIDQLKGSGNEAVLAKPVTDLNLSVRARKALQLLSIHSLGDLVSHTEAELMGVKNFGATSLQEVKQRLGELNLSLRLLEEDEA